MNVLCDRWLALSPRCRIVCWGGWSVTMALMVMLCLLYPLRQEWNVQREELRQQHAANQAQWRNLYQLVTPADPTLWANDENTMPFSALDFQTPLSRLTHWQPSAQGGEMTLKPAWDSVPALFVRLAERGMQVNSFSLRLEDAELMLTLQLERLNDG